VLVVQNTKGGHWGFPKGTPEGSETPMQTAIRELQEETGIEEKDIRIQNETVFIQQYSFEKDGVTYDKTNTYYAGFVTDMTIGNNLDEITEARWVSIDQAKELFNGKAMALADEVGEYLESLEEYNW